MFLKLVWECKNNLNSKKKFYSFIILAIIICSFTVYKTLSRPSSEESFSSFEPLIVNEKTSSFSDGYAVIVGISDYQGSSKDLEFCDDDAQEFKELLLGKYGFKESNIHLLINSDATLNNLKNVFQEVNESAAPDDLLVFWFSGHGSRDNLVLYDSSLSDKGLSNMLNLNVSARAIFVDMCYAESLFSEGDDLRDLGNSIVLASSEKNGFAYEDSGFQNGVFSYFLFEAFYGDETDLNQDRTTSLEEVFQKANKSTVEYTTENAETPQIPQIFDNYTEELSLEIVESVHPNFALKNLSLNWLNSKLTFEVWNLGEISYEQKIDIHVLIENEIFLINTIDAPEVNKSIEVKVDLGIENIYIKKITVIIDPQNKITEINEEDNQETLNLEFYENTLLLIITTIIFGAIISLLIYKIRIKKSGEKNEEIMDTV